MASIVRTAHLYKRLTKSFQSKNSLWSQHVRNYKAERGCFGFRPKPVTREPVSDVVIKNRYDHANILRIVSAFRQHGYKKADLDPLNLRDRSEPQLDLSLYGIDNIHKDVKYPTLGIMDVGGKPEASIEEILEHLEKTYCGKISFETSHMDNVDEMEWFCTAAEKYASMNVSGERKQQICELMLKSQLFDNFLAKKFPTLKRYSGEGAESAMVFFDEMFALCTADSVEDVILCMPHRGRANLLTGLLKYPEAQMFHKVKGNAEFPAEYSHIGDVLSHLTNSVDLNYGEGTLHVTMLPNPSHLEAVNPVAVGKTRGRQLTKRVGAYSRDETDDFGKVVCLQVHGDAAFCAQGIVMETLAMSSLPHFDIGGSIHFICNNQIGFTTPSPRANSSLHSSDIAKMIGCPIIHVNGYHPEEVLKACHLAYDYKRTFNKDVLINMLCFRRWGHNELDDPTFTQPSMYKVIHSIDSVPDAYFNSLNQQGIVDAGAVNGAVEVYQDYLDAQYKLADACKPKWSVFEGSWKGLQQAGDDHVTVWNTGCPIDLLKFVGAKSAERPAEFETHSHLKKTFQDARIDKLTEGMKIDWATAEMLAMGTLIYEGKQIRICGQDVGRGTFSHRHAMLVDQGCDELNIPINNMYDGQQGFLEVVNSHLSEEAVLAHEYGMSIENPNHLLIWEAQFGDFFNGAQIIIDTFISNGELKWLLQSGLVMLLPHGMDGAGPDHSSCKIERFLQLSDSKEDGVDGDNVNMRIVNPTTPAQYFHLLRSQMLQNFRKPLIVASPKVILRMSAATSSLEDMSPGTHYHPVLGDSLVDPSQVKKVMLCSGKHFYELDKQRKKRGINDVAIVRLESLVPFPCEEIKEELKKYSGATEFVWCQEEHRNQGAWSFVHPRFENLLHIKLSYAGRKVLGASAVGVGKWHAQEVEQLMKDTFGS